MQTFFVQSIHATSVEIFHRPMLLGDGRRSKVEVRQKEIRLTGNANTKFHEKSYWMQFIYLLSLLTLNLQLHCFRDGIGNINVVVMNLWYSLVDLLEGAFGPGE